MEKLNLMQMNQIYGGMPLGTTIANPDPAKTDYCDVHYDDNNDGKVNVGECLEIVECPTIKV